MCDKTSTPMILLLRVVFYHYTAIHINPHREQYVKLSYNPPAYFDCRRYIIWCKICLGVLCTGLSGLLAISYEMRNVNAYTCVFFSRDFNFIWYHNGGGYPYCASYCCTLKNLINRDGSMAYFTSRITTCMHSYTNHFA